MWRKVVLSLLGIVFAFGILFVSVFRTASVRYEFAGTKGVYLKETVLGDNGIEIDYFLPYPGNVLPDSPLWSLKALRDKLWQLLTTNPTRRAELNLLFADKRVGSSLMLFQKDNPEDGFSTLSKAEKYLEKASNLEKENRAKGIDTSEFLRNLANSSLKHYDVIQEILKIAPDDAKPKIIEIQWYSKKVYEDSRNALLDKGIDPPKNPFDWR